MKSENINTTSQVEEKKNNEQQDKAQNTQHEQETPTIQEETKEEVKVVEKNVDYKDQYLRIYAEFENFKKRAGKEKRDWIQFAGKEILLSMIEVLDDCNRADEQLSKLEPNQKSIVTTQKGIRLVFEKLNSKLKSHGIVPMNATDQDFDVNMHEAVTEIEDKSKKGKIIAEVQKGYTLNDKVLRYAKVVVGK